MYIEWSGQFEHQLRARQTLRIVFPAVIGVIVLILYLTYHSMVDTVLMMTSVLGALAGGAIFQWLFGFQLQRGRLGGLHRLLRHGGGDGRGDAGLPARGHRRARRAGGDRLDCRVEAGDPRRRRAPAAGPSC